MTYAGYPSGFEKPLVKASPASKTLHFSIEGSAMFAGPQVIRSVLAAEAPYDAISSTEKPVAAGDYLNVKIVQVPPSVASVTFGYVSYATLTIIPFWSLSDGSKLVFTLTRDGAQVATREYAIQRKTFVWLLMLPVAWVNWITASEEEAFAASTRDFLATLGGKPPAALH